MAVGFDDIISFRTHTFTASVRNFLSVHKINKQIKKIHTLIYVNEREKKRKKGVKKRMRREEKRSKSKRIGVKEGARNKDGKKKKKVTKWGI